MAWHRPTLALSQEVDFPREAGMRHAPAGAARIAKQVWRDFHKHAFARRCYADPSDMGLKALQLSDRRREQDQTEREQLQLQHTLLTRLHHGWRRGIG